MLALVMSAFTLTGCAGFGQGKALTLANIGWDENVAVANLTKVLLEHDLGYERVDVDTSDDLDPWYLGKTKQGMAVPAYMDVRSIDELNGTDAKTLIYGIEPSSVMDHKVSGEVIPAYGLKQKFVAGPTAGMLAEVGHLYAFREDFVFLAWSPHWMNQKYDIRYLKDPKDAQGTTNDPAKCSTIVSGNLREDDPVAYAFMDALELTEEQINSLELKINKENDDPLAGARRWVSENREVVRPWIEGARKAR